MYKRQLWNIRRRKEHVLTPAEEKLLAAAGEMANAPENIYSLFADADLTFADAVDGQGNRHPLSPVSYTHLLTPGLEAYTAPLTRKWC